MNKSPKGKTRYRHRKKTESKSKLEFIKRPAKKWIGFISRNIIVGFILYLLFSATYDNKNVSGYKWAWEKFIVGNWKVMKEHPEYTFQQRQQLKLGFFGVYVQFINNHTPDSAIILMPSADVVNNVDKKRRMGWLSSKRHVTYFIYPRKAVYELSGRDSVYLDKVTHVAIVDGKGYDKLPYRVRTKSDFTVLPIRLEQKK